MSKKKNIEPDAEDLVIAQTEALADEILRLQAELYAEKDNRRALERQIDDLRASVTAVTSSASIAPPPPLPLVRPVVTVGGATMRFKAGAFIAKGKRLISEEVAAQPDLLEQIVQQYPGLFEQVTD